MATIRCDTGVFWRIHSLREDAKLETSGHLSLNVASPLHKQLRAQEIQARGSSKLSDKKIVLFVARNSGIE